MKTQKNKAITLVALVITMVVLIILAGISINMLFGENGIITKAKLGKAKFLGEDAREVVEQRVAAYKQDAAQKGVDTTLYDFWFMYNGDLNSTSYTDDMAIYLFEDTISAKFKPKSTKQEKAKSPNSIANNDAAYDSNTEYKTAIVVYNDYVTAVDKDIVVSLNAMEIDKDALVQLFLENENIATSEMSAEFKNSIKAQGLDITLNSSNSNNIVVEGNNGDIVAPQSESSVTVKPISGELIDINSFGCSYGTIDVIWLAGTTNYISSQPNSPNYLTGMQKVSWEGQNGAEENSGYYNYVANNDSSNIYNTQSKWANAKDSNNNYFVWIPRFAYRITYYDSNNNVVGYYDGYGRYNSSGISLELDEGIETVIYNNKKYIVHPAFMKDTGKKDCHNNSLPDYDRGGWENNISGFWVSKNAITMSSTTFNSVYTYGLEYDTTKNSHNIKGSEYGAMGYLLLSQYGVRYNFDKSTASIPNNSYGLMSICSVSVWVSLFNCDSYNSITSSTKFITKYYNPDTTDTASGVSYTKVGDGFKEVFMNYSGRVGETFDNTVFLVPNLVCSFALRGFFSSDRGIFYANTWGANNSMAHCRIVLI